MVSVAFPTVALLYISPVVFAELCGHTGVPFPNIACLSTQVTRHKIVGVLTPSGEGGEVTFEFLLALLLLCFPWATRTVGGSEVSICGDMGLRQVKLGWQMS